MNYMLLGVKYTASMWFIFYILILNSL